MKKYNVEDDRIIFKGYMIDSFSLIKVNDIDTSKQETFDLSYNFYINKNKNNTYKVTLDIMNLYTNKSKIDMKLSGFFEISSELDEVDRDYFLTVSAPSIIYPYIRTFISNVTGFDIDDTVVLPVIDFSKGIRKND